MDTTATSFPSLLPRLHRARSIVGVLLLGVFAAGCVGGKSGEAALELDPTSGPSGTTASVSIETTEVDLPIQLSDGTTTKEAAVDDAGFYETPWEFVGEPGDAIVLEVLAFGDDEIVFELSATFTITGAPEEPIEETGEPIEQTDDEESPPEDTAEEADATGEETAPVGDQAAAAVDVTVTVDPASGPAGETATITVTGEPNAPVTLTVNGVGSTGGTTDADGVYTFDTTFSGNDGDQIPVAAEVGVGADTRSGSAIYTIDNPESACRVTAEDLTVEQFHETSSLSPELAAANALSSIRVQSNSCEFAPGTFFVSISDANASGAVDPGDAFFITPQPADGSGVEIGIDRGGFYFLGSIGPEDVITVRELTGTPFDTADRLEDGSGWQLFGDAQDFSIQIIERGPDDSTPAYYDVNFGDALMPPQP